MVIARPFYTRYVKLPSGRIVPPEIKKDTKLFPFFKDCLGAIDGTHIEAFVPDKDIPRYRNRKGTISQNVLAACSFDLRFIYVRAGWEGSAADGRIYEDARQHDFAIPAGKYYLADAGFPSCDTLLVPYRGVRYHLKEWGRADQRYTIYVFSYAHTLIIKLGLRITRNCSISDMHKQEMSLNVSLVLSRDAFNFLLQRQSTPWPRKQSLSLPFAHCTTLSAAMIPMMLSNMIQKTILTQDM